MEDLERTIRDIERQLNAPRSRRYRPPPRDAFLETLATTHFELYRLGKIQSLDDAINCAREAVNASKVDWLRERRQSFLVHYLLTRGQRYDIENVIDISRSEMIGEKENSDNRHWLSMLANGLILQYGWTGNMSQLNEGIQSARRSLEGAYIDAGHLNERSMILAQGLSELHSRTKKEDNINEALKLVRRAIENAQTDEDKRDYMHKLAIILADRYENTGAAEQLEEAIEAAQKLVDITPAEDPLELAPHLNTLAIALAYRYKVTADITDLDNVVKHAKRAVDITPKDYPPRDYYLNTLATSLSDRYEQTKDDCDRDGPIESSLILFQSENVMPVRRVQAARQAIKLLLSAGQFQRANELTGKALEFLPVVCSRYLSLTDQQYAVTQTSGLAADACSLLLKHEKDPKQALETLEHGRGLIIGYLIDGRGDISELRKVDRELASEYGRLRSMAFAPIKDGDSTIQLQKLQEQEEIAADLEGCLRDIREKLPRFLLPPPADELSQYANEGPIVIVNVTSISSDALLVRTSGVESITLPEFKEKQVERYRGWGLIRGARDIEEEKGTQQDKRYRRFLSQLWTDCVRPVLDALGFLNTSSSSNTELPRVWWIGTGLASSLPFHAAGIHSARSEEYTSNYVISSYTPSIKALRYAREKIVKSTDPKVLLVTMQTTPGMEDLPGVGREEEKILAAINDPEKVRQMPQPPAAAVLDALRGHSIVHFACHGSSDLRDPSQSYLALQGASTSHPDRLTVKKISDSRLRRSWLAYLSACSTAQNKVPELADEALHLAAGFQVAGFQHTIASMWPSDDEICAQVAGIFYDELLVKKGMEKEGNRAVARALHTAVARVRSKHISKPSLWAQYIHLGA
ncbi:CHAT domain-containing protein [Aspergillus egyptiacus]|nr:CHAT domain-containing protein [Aspergillus egyptiacus]